MEANSWRIPLTTAIAPIIWGSTYYLTRNFLPPEYPLTAATIRALPAGLILLAITRKLPHGIWWIRTLIISTLTISGFFILVYISGSKLPSSIASMIMALSPIATITMAHLLLNEKITPRTLSGGFLGLLGVFTLLGGTTGHLDPTGLLAAGAGMISSALGFVLTRRWKPPVNATTFTAWQLTLGGMITTPIALLAEGIMPAPSMSTTAAFAYIVFFASILAYICWFTGVTRLPASTVSIIGLLNPLTGLVLGTVLAGEVLSFVQVLGCLAILGGIYAGVRTPSPQKS
ncbi:DMT family transporter [Rothia sp. ND6WE1A]|uniref:DMT family transporter n=1 Tax=Rothia sp. ND6WE1A TaxID=1848190 RepID=UPI00082F9C8F|nr:DMT family transporter [Rothia sp. ND6WE1A]